jgi:serine/threonine protein phosphatase PrpC
MKNKTPGKLETAAESDIGRKRETNEDRYAVVNLACRGIPSTLALVADGVGGNAAGEVASQMVVEAIARALEEDPCVDPVRALPRAVVLASRAVFAQARRDPALRGMATTIAAAWVIGDRMYTTTIGDSRIYLQREGKVAQASVDHTWVAEAVEYGVITPDQARNHPNAHILRRYLGGEHDPEPDQRLRIGPADAVPAAAHQGIPLAPGDAIILCSDGLSDLVSAGDIQHALRQRSLQDAVHELVELACLRGGHDNITVVALRNPRLAAKRGIWRVFGALPLFLLSSIGAGRD